MLDPIPNDRILLLYQCFPSQTKNVRIWVFGCEDTYWSKWRMMEPDPVLDSRLLDLQDRFRGLGVDFQGYQTRSPREVPSRQCHPEEVAVG
ncbi:hypothetical protein F1880_010070 [Penicillium rolfsii]|nr:hypothetical protein F1880_010070 [Penicillium rolfsii]